MHDYVKANIEHAIDNTNANNLEELLTPIFADIDHFSLKNFVKALNEKKPDELDILCSNFNISGAYDLHRFLTAAMRIYQRS